MAASSFTLSSFSGFITSSLFVRYPLADCAGSSNTEESLERQQAVDDSLDMYRAQQVERRWYLFLVVRVCMHVQVRLHPVPVTNISIYANQIKQQTEGGQ